MKVIFTSSHGSSKVDDVRNVKSGYARYLLRYNLAKTATAEELKIAEEKFEERKKQQLLAQAEARKVAEGMASITLTFTEKANEEGGLFGSISEILIAEKLTEALKSEVHKDQVKLEHHIKTLGEHMVPVALIEGVEAKIKVVVSAE